MRPATALVLLAASGTASAQAPRPLPASIRTTVGLPGGPPARFATASVALGALPWAVVGCVSAAAGVCFATQRVVLSEADRRALVARVADVQAAPRCEPEGFAPGDPAYTLDLTGASYAGHLPADPGAVEARTRGPCGAPARLAWWLAGRLAR